MADQIVRVRRATAEDASAIACVKIASWRATYVGALPQDVLNALDHDAEEAAWSMAVLRSAGEHGSVRRYLAVLECDSRVIGFVYLAPSKKGGEGCVELRSIYLEPGREGGGSGQILMNDALVWARRESVYTTLELFVLSSNLRAARFYERIGLVRDDEPIETRMCGAPCTLYRFTCSLRGE